MTRVRDSLIRVVRAALDIDGLVSGGEVAGVAPTRLLSHSDSRGSLTELYRNLDLPFKPVMCYISFSHQGVLRGPHVHLFQSECTVFVGRFRIFWFDAREESPTYRNSSSYCMVDPSELVRLTFPARVIHWYEALSENAQTMTFASVYYRGPSGDESVDELRCEDYPDILAALTNLFS